MTDKEITKSCVKVLTFERKFRHTLLIPYRYFIRQSIRVLQRIYSVFERLYSLVNWCIARAVFRWIGPVVGIYATYCGFLYFQCITPSFVLSNLANFGIFMILLLLIAGIWLVVVISWIDIPEREQNILDGLE